MTGAVEKIRRSAEDKGDPGGEVSDALRRSRGGRGSRRGFRQAPRFALVETFPTAYNKYVLCTVV